MATYYGQLSEFDKEKEDWSSYVEQLELFFEANSIEDVNERKAILLSSCGAANASPFCPLLLLEGFDNCMNEFLVPLFDAFM